MAEQSLYLFVWKIIVHVKQYNKSLYLVPVLCRCIYPFRGNPFLFLPALGTRSFKYLVFGNFQLRLRKIENLAFFCQHQLFFFKLMATGADTGGADYYLIGRFNLF